jgi:hypothetical protein
MKEFQARIGEHALLHKVRAGLIKDYCGFAFLMEDPSMSLSRAC